MGNMFEKTTVFCQLSGCTPGAERILVYEAENRAGNYGLQVAAALRLLINPHEAEGQQALTVIGPLTDNEKDWLAMETLDEALALPGGRICAISGCSMGNTREEMDIFDIGGCIGPKDGPPGVLVARGSCFYVLTVTLPILNAATSGRVSIRRFWNLAMLKGHFEGNDHKCLSDVVYGPISGYLNQDPWLFGDLSREALSELDQTKATPEEITEIIRTRGYWMWMRPDRFPIEPTFPQSFRDPEFFSSMSSASANSNIILLPEILHSLVAYLPLSDAVSLALGNKLLYSLLLGTIDARNTIAKAYIRLHAPWCLPYGEAELKWWNDRDGDKALGWEYLKRCCTESHSMRNRERIWKTAESIEEECEKEEHLWVNSGKPELPSW